MRLKRPQREDEIIPIEVVDVDELADIISSAAYELHEIFEEEPMTLYASSQVYYLATQFLESKNFVSSDTTYLEQQFYEFFIANL